MFGASQSTEISDRLLPHSTRTSDSNSVMETSQEDARRSHELLRLLTSSLSSSNAEREQAAQIIQETIENDPNIHMALLKISANSANNSNIRLMAGIITKNHILKPKVSLSQEQLRNLANYALGMIDSPENIYKKFLPGIISKIAEQGENRDFFISLIQFLTSRFAGSNQIDGQASNKTVKAELSFMILKSVLCSPRLLEHDKDLIEQCLVYINQSLASYSENNSIILVSLNLYSDLIDLGFFFTKTQSAEFLEFLFKLCSRMNCELLCNFISLLSTIYTSQQHLLEHFVPQIVNLIIQLLQDNPPNAILLVTTEFLRSIISNGFGVEFLHPVLDNLIELLASHVVFKPDEIEMIEEFNERNTFVAINVFSQSSSSSEDPYDLIFNRWNARKSASLTLEMLANTFGENVSKKFFFVIEHYMKKEHWKYVEAANLIFGAISEGLSDIVEEYLPRVIPLVFSAAYSGKIFVLRSTSVWALSRYSTFISNTDEYTEEYIKILIALISDRNKRVQLAAFYAFVQLQNVLQFEILPYFDEIVSSISKCMPYYDLVTFSSVSLYLLSVLETLHSYNLNSGTYLDLCQKILMIFLQLPKSCIYQSVLIEFITKCLKHNLNICKDADTFNKLHRKLIAILCDEIVCKDACLQVKLFDLSILKHQVNSNVIILSNYSHHITIPTIELLDTIFKFLEDRQASSAISSDMNNTWNVLWLYILSFDPIIVPPALKLFFRTFNESLVVEHLHSIVGIIFFLMASDNQNIKESSVYVTRKFITDHHDKLADFVIKNFFMIAIDIVCDKTLQFSLRHQIVSLIVMLLNLKLSVFIGMKEFEKFIKSLICSAIDTSYDTQDKMRNQILVQLLIKLNWISLDFLDIFLDLCIDSEPMNEVTLKMLKSILDSMPPDIKKTEKIQKLINH